MINKKMKTYSQLKNEQQKSINNFKGLFFAFSDSQFIEGLAKHNLSDIKKENWSKYVVSIGAGGYITKDRVDAFIELNKQNKKEMKQFKQNEKELIKGIVYEMFNHEFCITYNLNDALDCFDLKVNDLDKKFINKIMKEYNRQKKG